MKYFLSLALALSFIVIGLQHVHYKDQSTALLSLKADNLKMHIAIDEVVLSISTGQYSLKLLQANHKALQDSLQDIEYLQRTFFAGNSIGGGS